LIYRTCGEDPDHGKRWHGTRHADGRIQIFLDSLSLYLEDSVRERNFEWNLAFASDEVIEGLEKMCSKEAYPYTKEETNGETLFHVTLPDGNVTLYVRPQAAQHPPFNPILKFQRTILLVSMPEAGPLTVETFHRKLTLTFLRAGG